MVYSLQKMGWKSQSNETLESHSGGLQACAKSQENSRLARIQMPEFQLGNQPGIMSKSHLSEP